MEKNNLIHFNGSIFRILELRKEKVFVIDCCKRNVPKWIPISDHIGKQITKPNSNS